MKPTQKTQSAKNSSNKKTATVKKNFDAILAYCGYKLDGEKIVATEKYNPVPYQGL
ncbi:MAG: hypothetical protein K6B43_13725 [Treponema sp.]|nr:hypothetical protein [Treponema sp.]